LLVLLLALGGVAVVVWLRRPPPAPPPEAVQAEEGDTGFSRQATEDRMRAIGYVQ
jgi:hypothetical protein